MLDRFQRIVDECQPYLVASRYSTAAGAEVAPLGLEIAPELRFDPLRVESSPFLNVLQRLDELTFGPIGMTMPRWVFYDCAEIPGGIFGFARPAKHVPEWARRALHVDDHYEGLVPLSMFVAIPMLAAGAWHTYTLCSLNQVAPGATPAGLRLLTEAAGLRAFGIETAYGATQWRSPILNVHSRFGPLELITAWTPAHSDPWTLTFRFNASRERIARALAESPQPPPDCEWVDCDDEATLRELQARIEAGRRIRVIGMPVIDGSFTRVPIDEVTP